MQSQYGTDKVKAILQFSVGAAGLPTLKAGLNCSLIGSPTGTVVVNGVTTTLAAVPGGNGVGRYLVQLADGPVIVGSTTNSGDNDNNTAVTVQQSGGVAATGFADAVDITFGTVAGAVSKLGGFTVNAGTIEIDFGASGATSPASGALIAIQFISCYDGANNTP